MNPIDYWLHEMDDLSVPMGEIVDRIQKEAICSGLQKAIWIVNGRLIPPKNLAYTRAIEESVVFLRAEISRIERGEVDGNVVTGRMDKEDSGMIAKYSVRRYPGSMNSGRFDEYRKDGWPLCPKCGEDELVSGLCYVTSLDQPMPTLADCLANGFHCLNCEWLDD